jgi:aconitate hydratase 2/2-methylisocitrate dehydratase
MLSKRLKSLIHTAATIEINLDDIKEPILACPNDPDDVKLLSEVANTKIDEVFIGHNF